MNKDMKSRILKLLEYMGPTTGAELARRLGTTRQSVNYHLKSLVSSGKVRKTGRTRGTRYSIPKKAGGPEKRTCSRTFHVEKEDEEEVFVYVSACLDLSRRVNLNVSDIFHYALTEMVNNVIDHSMADKGRVTASIGPYSCSFSVRDRGIGAFESIRRSHGLHDLEMAALEILKGKKTSAPGEHTGEGIFFTRQCADSFTLAANGIQVHFENSGSTIERVRRTRGTLVEFEISRSSSRTLPRVFSEYAPESFDYTFSRTVVHLRLYSDTLQSRSLARRVTAGVSDFREVVLDFEGVRSVGQGFADEIFRVFSASHPDVKLVTKNIDPVLRPMIRHVTKEGRAD